MKHRTCALIIALLLTVLSGCTSVNNSDNSVMPTDSPGAAASQQITQAQAEDIALNYVGLTADQVQRMSTQYEVDDRIPKYDVRFYADNVEYEFEIDAETGQIISFDKDN